VEILARIRGNRSRWQRSINFTQHPWQMEVSGFHHNVFGGFLSLRLAIFSAGRGEIRARDFRYRGLEGVSSPGGR
jgi:hypothetical protein